MYRRSGRAKQLQVIKHAQNAYISCDAVWQRPLKKLHTLKFFSKCVKNGTKPSQIENFVQTVLKLGQSLRPFHFLL